MSVLHLTVALLAWVYVETLSTDCHISWPCTGELKVGFWRLDCSNGTLTRPPVRPCPNTTSLDVSGNKLTALENDSFKRDALEYLQILILSRNAIESVHLNAFRGLMNLLVLWMDHNQLTYVPKNLFYNTPSLEWLDLSGNPLNLPGQSWFIDSKSLTRLNLAYAGLDHLPRDSFSRLERLEHLDLDHNRLDSVPLSVLDILGTLKELRLDGNPLQCDCDLQPTWKWTSDKNVDVKVECKGPSDFVGTSWERLKDLDCSPVMIDAGIVALFGILAALVVIVVLVGLVVMRQRRGTWGFVRKDYRRRSLPQIPPGEYIDILPPEKMADEPSKVYESVKEERYVEAGRGSYLPMLPLGQSDEHHYVNTLKPPHLPQRPMTKGGDAKDEGAPTLVPESPRRSSIPSILNGCDYYEVVD